MVAALERDPVFRIDRLSSALLDCGDSHAAFTVATQAGSNGWGSHQQLSVLGANGWLRFDFPYAHGRSGLPCRIEFGDNTSVGSQPTSSYCFGPVNQSTLQVERFSRSLLGHAVPSWAIEDALGTLQTIEALFESARGGGWQRVAGTMTATPCRLPPSHSTAQPRTSATSSSSVTSTCACPTSCRRSSST